MYWLVGCNISFRQGCTVTVEIYAETLGMAKNRNAESSYGKMVKSTECSSGSRQYVLHPIVDTVKKTCMQCWDD